MINLNFDKQGDAHKTLFGGLYSLIIKLIILEFLYLNMQKLFMHIDDNNVSTLGLIDMDKLGDVQLMGQSSMLIFHVIRKQRHPPQLVFGQEINDYVEMYFSQEVYDYEARNFSSVKYPWKECTLDDFNVINKKQG